MERHWRAHLQQQGGAKFFRGRRPKTLTAAGIDLRQLLVLLPRNGRELLWCANEALRSGSCSAVVTWAHRHTIGNRALRQLQQAADE